MASPLFANVIEARKPGWPSIDTPAQHRAYTAARERLITILLKVMADHRLDAIVHKAVEHQPTSIRDGVAPPFVDPKGAPHINTYLWSCLDRCARRLYPNNLPAGITFLGRPYDDARMIQLAYAYEQADAPSPRAGDHALTRTGTPGNSRLTRGPGVQYWVSQHSYFSELYLRGGCCAMLRTGNDYLAAIRDGRKIYVGNELVRDVTVHPAFRNSARSFGELYDRKRSSEHRDATSFEEGGERFSAWYLKP